jgi:5-(carboxyamino)imidazole ribonucleotide synthase
VRNRVVKPGSVIGILGGGQLGRMMALAGRHMGYRFVTLDPQPDSPCGQVCDAQITAAYTDVAAAEQLAGRCDVITYEFENVDVAVTEALQRMSWVPQGSRLLATTRHRVREKRAVEAAGAKVAPYRPVFTRRDLEDAIRDLGTPCILKTTTGGYDGKGQWRLEGSADIDAVWAQAAQTSGIRPVQASAGGAYADADAPFIVERFVDFACELSVIVARSVRGEVRSFPPAENIHRNHILHLSIVPARVPEEVRRRAQVLAERIAEALDAVGVLAVEMFYGRDGEIYVNELAPRPHNSGHYTLDACETSQFEQHIRAICNLPLGGVRLWTPVVMVNILGEHLDAVVRIADDLPSHVKVHLYGKAEARPGRKMGHLNVVADSVEEALDTIDGLGIWPRL